MKSSLILTTLFFTNLALAGSYKCSPEGMLQEVDYSEKKIELTETQPVVKPYAFDPRVNYKKPFLIYYAIDTDEPFMQYSVRYELANLRKACEESKNVNYVAILNSNYHHFTICKDQKLRKINLPDHYPSLHEEFQRKEYYMSTADHTSFEKGPMRYLVRYKEQNRKPFLQYTLAHPDFLYSLIKLIISEKDLFPTEEWTPFLNLKSHGNRKNVLAGLHDCQEEAKKKSQQLMIDKHFTEDDKMFLKSPDYYHYLNHYSFLDKLALGASGPQKEAGLGEFNLGEFNLGEFNLGEFNLGNVIAGLGADEGLGADFSFGLHHITLSHVLNDLFNEKDENVLGFLMLESCDTNRDTKFHDGATPMIMGSYSAKASLWYRNLDWWTLMKKANGSSVELVKLLQDHTAKIKNIVVK